ILRVLGMGGFGITYTARDLLLGREVVIKENLPEISARREKETLQVVPRNSEEIDGFNLALKSFVREARTLASFEHPNIVRVLNMFYANGTAYFVMPFERGRSLEEEIADREQSENWFSVSEIRNLLGPVLEALDVLHRQNVFHRDIKPQNILITESGTPILIDFGAARRKVADQALTVLESPGYTPFEQCQDGGGIGPWSDLYGLAGTVYRALTLRIPPNAQSRLGTKDPIIKLSGFASKPEEKLLFNLLDEALETSIENRPLDVKVWKRRLEEVSRANRQKADQRTDPAPGELVGPNPFLNGRPSFRRILDRWTRAAKWHPSLGVVGVGALLLVLSMCVG
ncbi:MAG: serine/threonine-protein kinase, partial [Verrucomicrobiota bacterium]